MDWYVLGQYQVTMFNAVEGDNQRRWYLVNRNVVYLLKQQE